MQTATLRSIGSLLLFLTACGTTPHPPAVLESAVSVRDFGAEGNGETDDGPALQRVLDSGAARVYLPPGHYRIGPQPLTVPPDVLLYGEGPRSVLHLSQSTRTLLLVQHGARLRDFAVEGSAAVPREFDEPVVSLPPGADAHGVTIEGLHFSDCEGTCIRTAGADDMTIRHCMFTRVERAISIEFSSRVRVLHNTVRGASKHGIQFWGNWEWEEKRSADLLFAGNIVKDGGEGAIWGCGATRVVLTGNFVDGAEDVGLDLEWCDDSTIAGNTVRNCRNAGISLFFASRRVTISGNTVHNDYVFDADPDGWWCRAGIWLTYPNRETFPNDYGHRDVTIAGNTVYNEGAWRRPIWVGRECDHVTIADNTLVGGDPAKVPLSATQPVVLRELVEDVTVYGEPPSAVFSGEGVAP